MNIKKVSSALLAAYNAAAAFVKAYPGGIAGATTAVVALAATFGLHVTVNELAAIVSAVAVVAGVLVHLNTVPKPATPTAPTHLKMGVTAQSNFTSESQSVSGQVFSASTDGIGETDTGNTSYINSGSSMSAWDTAGPDNATVALSTFDTGGMDNNSIALASFNSSSPSGGSNTATINAGSTMAGWDSLNADTNQFALSSFNTGAASAGTAHTHGMGHSHLINHYHGADTTHVHAIGHDHVMGHGHAMNHYHSMPHGHLYGGLAAQINALITSLQANIEDYQNLVNRVNGVINHDNQGGATKLWECLGV
jgi:hypothetical protein